MSCFVFQEKTDVEPVIPPKLEEGRDAILAIADRVERVQDRHKVPGEEFRGLKFGLVEVVYEWAKGMASVYCSRINRKVAKLITPLLCTAFRADHRVDGCCGRDNRARYYASG